MSVLRWLVPALIATGVLVGLGWTWLIYDELRQNQFIYSVVLVGGGSILAFVWTLLTARRARTRVLCLLGALAVGAIPALFRIEEVTGDLLPRLAPRWAPKADAVLPELPAPSPRTLDAETPGGLVTAAELATTPLDYPRFLGVEGLARAPSSEDRRLSRDWTAAPPRLVWRQPIGAGWSSFAVVGDFAFTQEQRGDDELVVCYRWRSGDALWSRAEPVRFDNVISGTGPRATPTVVGARVYAQGATGILVSLDATTGQTIWRRDTLADSGGSNHDWGTSGSPLVLEELVLVTSTAHDGALLAYDRESGEPRWNSGPGPSSYASPALRTIAGREQILALHHRHLAGHDPATGKTLWTHDWPGGFPKVPQPVVVGERRVLVSSGYGVGAELLELTPQGAADGTLLSVRSVWKNNRLKSKFANIIVQGDTIFGLDDGILCALDLESGERLWKGGRYGHGQILEVDGLLLVSTEGGDVVLVEPSREALQELTRFHAIDGKTWNHPVLIGRHLLIRNGGEAACWELPEVPASS